MHFQLTDIEAYLTVVESSSIGTAARRSGVAKSVLSKRIARLEQSLGAELLHRSTLPGSPRAAYGFLITMRLAEIVMNADTDRVREVARVVTAHRQREGADVV